MGYRDPEETAKKRSGGQPREDLGPGEDAAGTQGSNRRRKARQFWQQVNYLMEKLQQLRDRDGDQQHRGEHQHRQGDQGEARLP